MTGEKHRKWVTVYRAWGFPEAHVVRGLLETSGIKCFLESAAAPSVHAFNIDGMGEVRVKVLEDDAADAEALIHDSAEPEVTNGN